MLGLGCGTLLSFVFVLPSDGHEPTDVPTAALSPHSRFGARDAGRDLRDSNDDITGKP